MPYAPLRRRLALGICGCGIPADHRRHVHGLIGEQNKDVPSHEGIKIVAVNGDSGVGRRRHDVHDPVQVARAKRVRNGKVGEELAQNAAALPR